ncbi:MAG: O-antigen ligase family protein [Chloroflexi bacterium]|nr:O-antigen ligase family protein [Chloroflexota bacterium]MCC6892966.1 O-antigen ligase family protein [Anaerolineae bacterium]
MVYAFWHPIEERYRWLPLLIVVPVFMLVRLILHGRLFTRFPLDILFIAFLLLGLLNLYLSPYTAAHPMSRLYQLGRPALGMALCVYFVEYVRQYKHLDGLLTATLLLTGLIGVVALFASDWTSKSDQLIFIINALPPFSAPQALFGKFNVNEIAGSLVWLVPLSAGLCAWRGDRLLDRILRWGFVGVFVITSTALLLGQSRFALAGALFTLALMVPLLIKGRRGRLTAWIAILVFIILEIMIVRNVFTSPGQVTLAGRDESSMAGRLDVWSSAFDIIRANPLTGVGMNLFRDAAVRRDFPAPLFDQPVLPHAHNEYLQIATDLGLPGFVLFIAIYAVAFQMLYRTYRAGSPKQKALAVAAAGGLVAHALFGFGDAVTLWDRFAFVWWWLLALGSASYYMAVNKTNPYFHNGS